MKALTLAELIWQNYNLACTVLLLNQKDHKDTGDKEYREAKEAQLLENFVEAKV